MIGRDIVLIFEFSEIEMIVSTLAAFIVFKILEVEMINSSSIAAYALFALLHFGAVGCEVSHLAAIEKCFN